MIAALAATTLSLFTSCSDEDFVKMSTKTGDPIRFTAVTRSVETRTVYGDLSSSKWPLYWVSEDQVKVHCPEAQAQSSEDAKTAIYSVVEKAANDKTVRYDISGEGLYWSDSEKYHFYEAYPAKNVQSIAANVLTATMPSTQHVKKYTDKNGTYYADMDAALMAGKSDEILKKNVANGTTKSIDLPFKPIFTAVDITILPATSDDYTITSLTIANVENDETPSPIAGTFTYDIDNEEYGNLDSKFNVQVQFDEKIDFTHASVPLRVTVFLRGDFSEAIKVVVNAEKTSTDPDTHVTTTLIGSFKKQCYRYDRDEPTKIDGTLDLTAGARNHLNLGVLPSSEFKEMTGEWWVSHTEDEIYVSQMSLPGVYDASGFVDGTKGSDRAQTTLFTNSNNKYYEQMKAYLNAGNRAFDFKFEYDASYAGEWKTTRAKNLTSLGAEPASLDKFVLAADEWLKVHTTEFLVFFVSDYDHENNNSGYRSHISQYLRLSLGSRLLESFSPDITVEEARGKILIVNASQADNPVGLTTTGWILNKRVKYTSDGDTSDNEIAYNEYDLGADGKIYVQDYNNATSTSSSLQNKKKEYLDEIIKIAKEDTDVKHWYYVSNAFRHYEWLNDLTYSDATKKKFRPEMKARVLAMSNGATYEKTGIVFQAYAANNDNLQNGEDSRFLEDIIWKNNYKANGPRKKK